MATRPDADRDQIGQKPLVRKRPRLMGIGHADWEA